MSDRIKKLALALAEEPDNSILAKDLNRELDRKNLLSYEQHKLLVTDLFPMSSVVENLIINNQLINVSERSKYDLRTSSLVFIKNTHVHIMDGYKTHVYQKMNKDAMTYYNVLYNHIVQDLEESYVGFIGSVGIESENKKDYGFFESHKDVMYVFPFISFIKGTWISEPIGFLDINKSYTVKMLDNYSRLIKIYLDKNVEGYKLILKVSRRISVGADSVLATIYS
jgi:hypothetical protein